jgi:acetoin utilization deacetylase AcuC-like enzyme
MSGEAKNAFCAVRPPGHHAASNSTMGFCVFNNIAIGIEQLRARHGVERVAVVDFDVHHGNGTQAIYRADANVLFASIHQSFTFPKSGDAGETGAGNLINVPLVRKSSRDTFKSAFEDKILSRLRQFEPQFLFVSAGFDAHVRDPIGEQRLMTDDFTWLTKELVRIADGYCGGRIVSVLEGGYNPEAVADAGAAHVRALMAA